MQIMKTILKSILLWKLTLFAKIMLWRFKPKIIMVTGSVGKTSTKDALYSAIKSHVSVRKSEKSMNSEYGVPLTILGIPNAWNNYFFWAFNMMRAFYRVCFTFSYPAWLILEVGADHPGDLSSITSWVKPDIVVVTRFPEVAPHVAFYDSPQQLRHEESIPVYEMNRYGVLIANDDDEHAVSLATNFAGNVITYGLTPRANVFAGPDQVIYETKDSREVPQGIRFAVTYSGTSMPFEIHEALGVQHIYPVLAGIAVGLHLGMTLEELHRAFEMHQTPLGRMHILPGIKHTTIIDDSYNSSPAAVELALMTLKELETKGRRIAALGDMRELGEYAKDAHRKVGKQVSDVADILVTVGPLSRDVADAALDAGMDENTIFQFENSREAGKFMETIIKEGDIILVKGSQNTIFMERLVLEIMEHPEDAHKLLVRQESAWQDL